MASELVESIAKALPEILALPDPPSSFQPSSLDEVPPEVTDAIPPDLFPIEPPSEASPLFAAYSRGKFEPPVAIDINDDPDVVEVVLVAHPSVWEFVPGVPTVVWTYNGTIPGPTIEAKAGDHVIVHLLNLLPEPTTIHWHGVEVPAAMDGTHVTQAPIEPGESFTYEFDLLTPALYWYHPHHRSNVQVENGLYAALLVHGDEETLALPEGTRETILVLDDVVLDGATNQLTPEFPDVSDPTARAEVMVNGKEELNTQSPILLVNGKAGRTLEIDRSVTQRFRMVNSANSRFMRMSIPEETTYLVGGDAGLLSAPEERPAIERRDYTDPGHPCHDPEKPFRPLPNCQGAGSFLSDGEIDHGVLLTPGERADVVWTPSPGAPADLPLDWNDWSRGRHAYQVWGERIVAGGHVHGGGGTLPTQLPLAMAGLRLTGATAAEPFVPNFDDPVAPVIDRDDWGGGLPPPCEGGLEPPACVRRLVVEYGHTHHPDEDGNVTFWVQTEGTNEHGMCGEGRIPVMGEPGKCGIPMGVFTPADAYDLEVGETVIWEVRGLTHADHNFHTHGFFFQPLEYETVTTDVDGNVVDTAIARVDVPVQNKDTILIPKGPTTNLGSRTILRAAARIDDTGRPGQVVASGGMEAGLAGQPGGWMFHCHILEHSARGMMAYFEVQEGGQ